MNAVKPPRSLRFDAAIDPVNALAVRPRLVPTKPRSDQVRARNVLRSASGHARTRVASFLPLQSMVRDAGARSLIFDLDTAIQGLVERLGRDDPETVKLTGTYHNLIRHWAEV
jgi:hypothetical protein